MIKDYKWERKTHIDKCKGDIIKIRLHMWGMKIN